jgi:hypothetical protein
MITTNKSASSYPITTFTRQLATLPTSYNETSECQNIIPKEKRKKTVNLNPTDPSTKGLIKVHKTDAIVKWKNAPAYKVARMLAKKNYIYMFHYLTPTM